MEASCKIIATIVPCFHLHIQGACLRVYGIGRMLWGVWFGVLGVAPDA